MSKHRLERPGPVRPRVGRIAAAGLSLTVTAVALLGGIGVIPLGGPGNAATNNKQLAAFGAAANGVGSAPAQSDSATPKVAAKAPAAPVTTKATRKVAPKTSSARTLPTTVALPAASGSGRRVVFSISGQRVWLVDADGVPISTYLVSGSVTHNLEPGKYDVFSRSRWAVGIDDSGVMQYFVRFAHGANAAIGFHSIPTKNGQPLQTVAELGTPRSHGCIRQKLTDAERMWGFADVGTDVVVVA
ncbi:MAG: L,D-transpeptidase [Marmoricola sp.]